MSGRDGARPLVTGTISIGEVLSLLKHEFPDVTISKIRFLESEGLVAPERTASASCGRAVVSSRPQTKRGRTAMTSKPGSLCASARRSARPLVFE